MYHARAACVMYESWWRLHTRRFVSNPPTRTHQWEPYYTLHWASARRRVPGAFLSLSLSLLLSLSGISLLCSLSLISPLLHCGELLEAIGRQPAFTSCHLPLCSASSFVCFAMHIAYYYNVNPTLYLSLSESAIDWALRSRRH